MKVMVVDDHPLILEALRHVLQQLETGVEVINCRTGAEGRAMAAAHPDVDLMLLDLTLPDADGFDLLREFRGDHPAIPVVVLSGSERREDVLRALDLGAMGYIPKKESNEVMLSALRLVMSGALFVPSQAIAPAAAPASSTVGAAPRPQGKRTEPEDLKLTPRQSEVLAYVLEALPNKLICRRTGIAEGTVKAHVAAALQKLDVTNRVQAVIRASELGLTIEDLRRWASQAPAGD